MALKTLIPTALLAAAIGIALPAAPAAASGIFPGLACSQPPSSAWQFVRHVQPPFGLGYDLYNVRNSDGTYGYFSLYCR